MKKVVLIKTNESLIPASRRDVEILDFVPNGASINADIRTKNPRSLKMHRMYWALIELALDYWNPTGGLINKCEKDLMIGIVAIVRASGTDCGPIRHLLSLYAKKLSEERTASFEPIHKDSDMLHNWIKEQVDMYDWIMTPDGLIKKTKSISFDSMSHESWMQYYKQAFGVVWNLVLSEIFKTEAEAQEAIERLSKMG